MSPPRTDRQLRVALIGAGLMGAWHVRAAQRAGATIAAIIDKDFAKAQRLAASLGVRAATDLDGVDGPLDAVHVATPPATHDAIIREAINAGIHALVEKPMAETAAATQAILDLAAARGLLVCPVHQLLFQRGTRSAIRRLGAVGAPATVAFRIYSAGGVGSDPARLDNIVGEILPHPLSVLAAFWPDTAVDVREWSVHSPAAGEFVASGCHSGAAVTVAISLASRPTCFEMSVAGSDGTIDIDFFHGYSVFFRGGAGRSYKVLRPFAHAGRHLYAAGSNLVTRASRSEVAYPGLAELVDAFYAAIRGKARPPVPTDQIFAVAAARDILASRFARGLGGRPHGRTG